MTLYPENDGQKRWVTQSYTCSYITTNHKNIALMSTPLVTALVSSDIFPGGRVNQCGGYSLIISLLLGPALDTGPVLASFIIAVILIGASSRVVSVVL